jgi:Tol biopolymer transport system component
MVLGARLRLVALVFTIGLLLGLLGQPARAASPGRNGSIAFVFSRPDELPHIWKMDADGSHARRLGPPAARHEPTWSPDGLKVAYWKREPQMSGTLRIMRANGTQLRTLGRFAAVPSELGWSPDGKRIALSAMLDCYRILIIDARSGEIAFRSPCFRGDPAWSPDGRRIAFTKLNGDVFTMDRRGRDVQRLTNTDSYDARPDWAPDGSAIVFTAFGAVAGEGEVAVVGRHGGAVTELTNSAREESNAVFSPNGKRILFDRCCYGPGGIPWIFSMKSDGTDVTRIRPGSNPDWQPLPD